MPPNQISFSICLTIFPDTHECPAGYSELIKRELTDPKLLDYQEKMEQSGNLLLSIINNVLDMARIESGKVELDEDYVKIRDIYQGIYKIFQAEAEKKCIHLKMEYDVKHEHVLR